MADRHRVGSLEVNEDLRHERREWQVQRMAWAVFTVVLLLTAGGIFGDGPLSDQTVQHASGRIVCRYEQFVRQSAMTPLRVRIEAAGGAPEWRLHLNHAYLQRMRVEAIAPAPERTEVTPEGMAFVFTGQEGVKSLPVVLFLVPEEPGLVPCRLWANGVALAFRQFVYP